MGRGNLFGVISARMRENYKITISVAGASTNGTMDDSSRVTGSIIKCRERAYSRGPTEGSTSATTRMTKSTELVPLRGRMDACTTANGLRASSTGEVPTSKIQSAGKECGSTARGLSGSSRVTSRKSERTGDILF